MHSMSHTAPIEKTPAKFAGVFSIGAVLYRYFSLKALAPSLRPVSSSRSM